MKKNKIAFITGVTGQDGSYLAELLLEKNYTVHGLLRRTSILNVERIQDTINRYEKSGKFKLHYMDLTDTSSISNLIKKFRPHEFYNLAAMSHVGISYYTGEATINTNSVASYRIQESILNNHKSCKDQDDCVGSGRWKLQILHLNVNYFANGGNLLSSHNTYCKEITHHNGYHKNRSNYYPGPAQWNNHICKHLPSGSTSVVSCLEERFINSQHGIKNRHHHEQSIEVDKCNYDRKFRV